MARGPADVPDRQRDPGAFETGEVGGGLSVNNITGSFDPVGIEAQISLYRRTRLVTVRRTSLYPGH